MRTLIQLCRVTAMRALQELVSAIFTLLLAPAFIGCMGLISGNNPLLEFGGKEFLEANFIAFPGIVTVISTPIIVSVDLATQWGAGVLRRFRTAPLNLALHLAADVVSRLTLGLVSFVAMYVIAVLGFGVRPASAGVFISTLAAIMLGLTAFLAADYLIAGRFRNVGAVQGLGNILMYPLILTSGVTVPLAMPLPSILFTTKHSLMTQLTYPIRGLWNGEGWGEYRIAAPILLAFGTVCAAAAMCFFRWG